MVRLSKNRFRVRDVEAEEWQQQTTARMVEQAVCCDQRGVSSEVWLVISCMFTKMAARWSWKGCFFSPFREGKMSVKRGSFYYFNGEKQAKAHRTTKD